MKGSFLGTWKFLHSNSRNQRLQFLSRSRASCIFLNLWSAFVLLASYLYRGSPLILKRFLIFFFLWYYLFYFTTMFSASLAECSPEPSFKRFQDILLHFFWVFIKLLVILMLLHCNPDEVWSFLYIAKWSWDFSVVAWIL